MLTIKLSCRLSSEPPITNDDSLETGLCCDFTRLHVHIRHQTGVHDIIDVMRKRIHGWAEHIARLKYNRWTITVT